MKLLLSAVSALALTAASAQAQSVPYSPILQGQVWTPLQWNNAFASKLDVNGSVTTATASDAGNTTTIGNWLSWLPLTLTEFGADPTGTLACDAQWTAFIAAVMSSGREGFIPPGTYKFTSNATIDFGAASASAGAITLRGVKNRSILQLSGVGGSGPALLLTCTGTRSSVFYANLLDISIRAACAGPAVQIGLPNHSVAFNSCTFNLEIKNTLASTSAVGLAVHGAYNCTFFTVANNAGLGDALQVTEMQFSTVQGSYSNANIGVHLTNYYSFGNVFLGVDLEVVNTCVVIDSATATRNTFIGGTFVWSNGASPYRAIDASAGAINRFIGVNYGSASPYYAGITGIIVIGNAAQGSEVFAGVVCQPTTGDSDIVLNVIAGQSGLIQTQKANVLRWSFGQNNTTESGSNVGSDFQVIRFSDAGSSIDTPLKITRSSGQTFINNCLAYTLIVASPAGDSDIQLNAVANQSAFVSLQSAGVKRWFFGKNNTAEGGSNTGSDFIITRYTDAGATIDNPFAVTRSTGLTTIASLSAQTIGFFGAGVTSSRPTVSGSRASGAALTSLIGVLSSLGLITDGTTA